MATNQLVQVGPLRINKATHMATLHGRQLNLHRMEYDLLVHLAHKPSRVFRTPGILLTLWSDPESGDTRTLDRQAFAYATSSTPLVDDGLSMCQTEATG